MLGMGEVGEGPTTWAGHCVSEWAWGRGVKHAIYINSVVKHSLYYWFTTCDSLIKWQTGNNAVHIWTKYSDDRKCYFVPLAVHAAFSLGFAFELGSFLSYTWPLFWPNSEGCGSMTVRITESFSREPAAKRKSYLLISFLDRLEGGIGNCFAGFIQLALP